MASLMDSLLELERHGQLHRVREEVDPNLEMAEIQRRAYLAGAPALFFEKVKGSPFPCVSNLYGTMERCEFLFRRTLAFVKRAVQAKADPPGFAIDTLKRFPKHPLETMKMPFVGLHALPKQIAPNRAPVAAHTTTLSKLPQIISWPDDGGPFITLPQVFSEDPSAPGPMKANLGMYRVQIAGNDYVRDKECGIHYQIHRGIGIHHTKAIERGEPLKVSIFVGGHPAHTFAAVMPLPEGLSELMFAGMLAGRRFRWTRHMGQVLSADADFVITGTITHATRPEGPFGDHLGYYSLTHEFPVLHVEQVYHRKDAVWPFTVVGRPPQEDTTFGKMIHEITGPMVPVSLPGVSALHAVDAAGVHPLLLAIGSERYVPYAERRPQEILTQANAILGFNQCSLAKFLFIVAGEDAPNLDIEHIPDFFDHLLSRVDLGRDLHFQTRTTIDTLDYSGTGLNEGSKLVIAAAGKPVRRLNSQVPELRLPHGFSKLGCALPGILLVGGPAFVERSEAELQMERLTQALADQNLDGWPLLVVCDDVKFASRNLNNFLWSCFTRANPSHDCHGVNSQTQYKHWGCDALVIDARIKPHHAPPLIENPEVSQRVDDMMRQGRDLYGILD